MPGVFDRFGVKFMYPENWKLTEENGDDWPKTISVESPEGAFWTLHIYEPEADVESLVEEALEAFRTEYDQLESEPVIAPPGADYGVNIDFYCLDLIITAHIRGVSNDDNALVWIAQGESRDFDRCEPIFRAITTSLLGKIPSP